MKPNIVARWIDSLDDTDMIVHAGEIIGSQLFNLTLVEATEIVQNHYSGTIKSRRTVQKIMLGRIQPAETLALPPILLK